MPLGLLQSRSGRHQSDTEYQYETLDPQRNEIRLLKIRRSLRAKDPVSCSLRLVSLDDARLPNYAALSYCWGKGPADQLIYCDGGLIQVTAVLLDALHSLRKLTRMYLWIDQICVNQTDLEERSSQVQLMRIYPGAAKTFLHLGSAVTSTHMPLAVLNLFLHTFQHLSWLKSDG